MTERYQPILLDIDEEIAKAKATREGFRDAWDDSKEEYSALAALLEARKALGLTQNDLATKMGPTKSAISRLESSFRTEKHSPSFMTLKKYAKACGKRLVLRME